MNVYLVMSYNDGVISAHYSYEKADAERKWLDAENLYLFHDTYVQGIRLKD